jgi:hypothetical protein
VPPEADSSLNDAEPGPPRSFSGLAITRAILGAGYCLRVEWVTAPGPITLTPGGSKVTHRFWRSAGAGRSARLRGSQAWEII